MNKSEQGCFILLVSCYTIAGTITSPWWIIWSMIAVNLFGYVQGRVAEQEEKWTEIS